MITLGKVKGELQLACFYNVNIRGSE